MIKKVREMIKLIEKDGWYMVGQAGSHKQYKHNAKKGRVTIADHGKDEDLDHNTVKSIMKQAGFKVDTK